MHMNMGAGLLKGVLLRALPGSCCGLERVTGIGAAHWRLRHSHLALLGVRDNSGALH